MSSWWTVRAVGIPPDCLHQIDAADQPLLVMYVEPESREYLALSASLDRPVAQGRCSFELPDSVPQVLGAALGNLLEDGARPERLWSECLGQVGLNAPPVFTDVGDRRVRAVIDLIRAEPGRSFRVDMLARQVHLSPSRLSHLFKYHIGVPIRRYVVWARLRTVMAETAAGTSLTRAAHVAGFSDAAHLSRTFRQTFGFAPSVLFSAAAGANVTLVDV
ncbi:MAG: AraC family transcriptional regulator [Pseudomonadales bacterium]